MGHPAPAAALPSPSRPTYGLAGTRERPPFACLAVSPPKDPGGVTGRTWDGRHPPRPRQKAPARHRAEWRDPERATLETPRSPTHSTGKP